MKDIELLKDLLKDRKDHERFYNEYLLQIMNPEVSQLLCQLRDDELRDVKKLQQKVEKLNQKPTLVSKFFPNHTRRG